MPRKTPFLTGNELDRFENSIRTWHGDGKDKKLENVYVSDRAELTLVLKLVSNGKIKAAAKEASRMDTIVRDEIPLSVYYKLFPDDKPPESDDIVYDWRITLRNGIQIEVHLSLGAIEAQYGNKLQSMERIW